MLDSDKLDWIVFTPLPVSVRLNYSDPTGCHALTPSAVRERYRKQVTTSALVVWKDERNGVCGLQAGIDEVAWRLAAIKGIELHFQRPAKGSGCVVLRVRLANRPADYAIGASQFDEELLTWFRQLGLLLSEAIPCPSQELDEGYDV